MGSFNVSSGRDLPTFRWNNCFHLQGGWTFPEHAFLEEEDGSFAQKLVSSCKAI